MMIIKLRIPRPADLVLPSFVPIYLLLAFENLMKREGRSEFDPRFFGVLHYFVRNCKLYPIIIKKTISKDEQTKSKGIGRVKTDLFISKL